VWLEYREVHSDGYQYSWFRERYREWRGTLDVAMRQVYRAGEKAFVDYAGRRSRSWTGGRAKCGTPVEEFARQRRGEALGHRVVVRAADRVLAFHGDLHGGQGVENCRRVLPSSSLPMEFPRL